MLQDASAQKDVTTMPSIRTMISMDRMTVSRVTYAQTHIDLLIWPWIGALVAERAHPGKITIDHDLTQICAHMAEWSTPQEFTIET